MNSQVLVRTFYAGIMMKNPPAQKELYHRKVTEHYNSLSLLDERKLHHFEIVFIFDSEDEIRFICEEIEFHEYSYHEEKI